MNETQADALQQASAELQARIDDLKSQKDAAEQALENVAALLPAFEEKLASLKDGLPEAQPTVIDGGASA
jgi:chromosome segregation ATPase